MDESRAHHLNAFPVLGGLAFRAASATSFTAFVLLIIFYAGSFIGPRDISYQSASFKGWSLGFYAGRFYTQVWKVRPKVLFAPPGFNFNDPYFAGRVALIEWATDSATSGKQWHLGNFELDISQRPNVDWLLQIATPGWFAPLTAAVFPLAWVWQFLMTRRHRLSTIMGRCPHCGYDVRASPDCCSECGSALAAVGKT